MQLWFQDSLIETEKIGYKKNYIKVLYEINKTTEIFGNEESIEITEVVKQDSIIRLTLCCATTAKVNDVEEKVDYKYGEIEIAMSIYIADVSVAGGPEEIKKRNVEMRKCARTEVEKKKKYSLSKTKFMIVKTDKEKEELSESRKQSKNQEIQILRNQNK